MSYQKTIEADMATAKWMFDIVRELQPEHKIPNFAEWAKDIRLMRERDGRTDADIRALFQLADRDGFWQSNIRCPAKLRKQWDKLDLKFRKSKGTGNGHSAEFEMIRALVKRVWSPDLKNHHDVETAIGNPELFAAARLTGLALIADASERDRDAELTFFRNLESIRSKRKATT